MNQFHSHCAVRRMHVHHVAPLMHDQAGGGAGHLWGHFKDCKDMDRRTSTTLQNTISTARNARTARPNSHPLHPDIIQPGSAVKHQA